MGKAHSEDLRQRVVAEVAAGGVAAASGRTVQGGYLFGDPLGQPQGGDRRGGAAAAWRKVPFAAGAARRLALAAHPRPTGPDTGGDRRQVREGDRDRDVGSFAAPLLQAPRHHLQKSLHAAEQERPDVAQARARWKAGQAGLDPTRLVFVDETGADTKMVRAYGRGPRGERLVCKQPWGHWKTTTFTAGLRCDGLVAPLVLDGPMTGEAFPGLCRANPSPHAHTGRHRGDGQSASPQASSRS